MSTYLTPQMDLPWSSSLDEDARFNKILIILVVVFLVLSIVITVMKVPALTRAEKEQLPPQLARVMLEKKELPPPKPIEPPKVEEKKPEEKKVPDKKVVDKQPVPVKSNEKVKDEAVTKAKEKAQEKFATFKDDLMEMRETLDTAVVENAATNTVNNNGPAAQVDRSMITSGITRGSGGINTAAYSRDTGGVAISGRETTKIKSTLAEAGKKATGAGAGNSDGAGGAARSEEEIRKVMEQHKGAIFSIYNRALRENAALQGKVVVKMVIDPSGQIVGATIVSSELKDPELETKLLQRIKLISFSASSVTRTTLNYSFDFLPQ